MFVLSLSSLSPAIAGPKLDGSCKKINQKVTVGKSTLICKKIKNKLVWKLNSSKATESSESKSKAETPPPVIGPEQSSESKSKEETLPPVIGPEPSQRVIAFYYGWYGNPKVDGKWIHWEDYKNPNSPPNDIMSDYFPELGAYSSNDELVMAKQLAMIRQSGIGVIAISYWPGETSDDRLTKLFKLAKLYGIKIAFHIEPSAERNNLTYADTIISLHSRFGNEPAYFRTSQTSRYVKSNDLKPLYFVWVTNVSNIQGGVAVPQSYWAAGNEKIHKETGALMIACPGQGSYTSAILDGKFDGAYNYATLNLQKEGFFNWWKDLPSDSLYIPSVIPGFSAIRVGYDSSTLVPRRAGAEYDDQWRAATEVDVEPAFISITSWNEWHEGSTLEPPAPASSNVSGRSYLDFSPLPPTYYMTATAEWIKRFEAKTYSSIKTKMIRLTVDTTSDWMDTELVSGQLIRPEEFSTTGDYLRAEFISNHFYTNQTVEKAQSNKKVTIRLVTQLIGNSLAFKSSMGAIGRTTITIEEWQQSAWKSVGILAWDGAIPSQSQQSVAIP
jgi:glycoprotein endo-alpha-1,2-mannosidase